MEPVGEPVMTRLRVLGAVSLPASSCASGGTEAALAGSAAGEQLQEESNFYRSRVGGEGEVYMISARHGGSET